MLEAAVALAIFLALAALVERQVKPRAPRLRRATIAWLTFIVTCALWYGRLLGLTGRLVLSLFLALVVAMALSWVSNPNYRLLREPFFFVDFALVPPDIQPPSLQHVECCQPDRVLHQSTLDTAL